MTLMLLGIFVHQLKGMYTVGPSQGYPPPLTSVKLAGTHLITCVERDTVRVKAVAQDRASGRSRKKSQISRDFLGQIRGKNGRFRGNFAGIFEASFAEKQLVKNGRFCESFPSKFRWKPIGFALI